MTFEEFLPIAVIVIIVFFVARIVILWYYKIDVRIALQEDILTELKKLNSK